MKRALRVVVWLALIAINIAGAALLYLKSARGREQVIAYGLRKLASVFPDGVSIGRSEGDVTRGVVLHQVVLRDHKGGVAIGARRVEVDYTLGALLLGRVQLDRLVVAGLNWASTPRARMAAPTELALSVMVRDADVQGRTPWVSGHARGRLGVSRSLVLGVDLLTVDVEHPRRGTVRAQGAVTLIGPVELRRVHARADLRKLRELRELPELRDPVLIVDADGRIDDLKGVVTLHSRDGHARARAHLLADRVKVSSLRIDIPGARANAQGVYRFDHTGQVSGRVEISELGAFVPDLSGSLRVDAELRREPRQLLSGRAQLTGRQLSRGGVSLHKLDALLESDGDRVRVALEARGPEGLDLDLVARGTRAGRDLDARIERLRIRAGGAAWLNDAPARVRVELQRRMIALGALGLSSGRQHITIEGRLAGDRLEDVHAKIEHFDLSQLPALISPGHVLPRTDLQAQLEAHGPLAAPSVGASFSGTAHAKSHHDLIRFNANGQGRLERGRLAGKAFATIGGQKASLTVDMPLPLRPGQPIAASFNASVLLNPWFADQLVPKAIQSQPMLLYNLGAKVTAQAVLHGTTSDPRVNASLRVARWSAADAHGDLGASFEYAHRHLGASGTLTFSSLPKGGGSGGGVVEATTELPIDLAPALSGRRGRFFDRRAEWKGTLTLKRVAIERLPFRAFDVVPPVRRGWVDATVALAGSAAHPKATVTFDARELDVWGVTDVGAVGEATFDDGAAALGLRASIRGNQALVARLGSRSWKGPLSGSAEVPAFELARLQVFQQIEGVLRARATLAGTPAQPRVDARLEMNDVRSGQMRYHKVQAVAKLADARFSAALTATQPRGGSLSARLDVPLGHGHGTIDGALDASHVLVDLHSELLPRLRELRGELHGPVRLSGSTRHPRLDGRLALRSGALMFASSAITHRDLSAQLVFDGQTVTLRDLRVAAGSEGSLSGTGRLTLRGPRIDRARLRLVLRRYPVVWETRTGVADATVTLDERGQAEVRQGRIEWRSDERGGLLPTAWLTDVAIVK
jgi:autotransporter translocation and assembly factor TamB